MYEELEALKVETARLQRRVMRLETEAIDGYRLRRLASAAITFANGRTFGLGDDIDDGPHVDYCVRGIDPNRRLVVLRHLGSNAVKRLWHPG
jgi:hypothetical protein